VFTPRSRKREDLCPGRGEKEKGKKIPDEEMVEALMKKGEKKGRVGSGSTFRP